MLYIDLGIDCRKGGENMLSYWRNGCETRCEACAWQDDCLYSRTRDIVVVQDEEGGDEND